MRTYVCFSCGKKLNPSLWDEGPPCSNAVVFDGKGNYGSSIWDPMNRSVSLLINICDDCLTANKDRVLLAKVERPLPTVTYTEWDPDEVGT